MLFLYFLLLLLVWLPEWFHGANRVNQFICGHRKWTKSRYCLNVFHCQTALCKEWERARVREGEKGWALLLFQLQLYLLLLCRVNSQSPQWIFKFTTTKFVIVFFFLFLLLFCFTVSFFPFMILFLYILPLFVKTINNYCILCTISLFTIYCAIPANNEQPTRNG